MGRKKSKLTKEQIDANRKKFFGPNKNIVEQNQKRNEKRGVAFKNNNNNSKNNDSTKTKQGKPKTKAQLLATRNIEKYGGTAKAAAANKEAMRLKIKKKYQESQKKKKKK